MSFAHTLGEFGVVLMIGGNIPGATRTISILIFDQVEALDYAAANRTALLLLVLCFALLALLYGLRRTRGLEFMGLAMSAAESSRPSEQLSVRVATGLGHGARPDVRSRC